MVLPTSWEWQRFLQAFALQQQYADFFANLIILNQDDLDHFTSSVSITIYLLTSIIWSVLVFILRITVFSEKFFDGNWILLLEFLPEICWEQVMDVWPGFWNQTSHLISQRTTYLTMAISKRNENRLLTARITCSLCLTIMLTVKRAEYYVRC